MMTYKGYIGMVEYDDADRLFHGEVINTRDVITFDEVFVDGTKLEANANRYTFVWRGSIEKYLGKR